MIPAQAVRTVVLRGCAPVPLAHYLKGLAVLRLVAEQVDSEIRGRWSDEGFVLGTRLDADDLVAFFLENFKPTPVVAPWNKGSGFFPWDNREAIDAIEAGGSERLTTYREVIAQARDVLSRLEILTRQQIKAYDKATTKAQEREVKARIAGALDNRKGDVLEMCRGSLADSAIEWFDAAVALTGGGPRFPPLLGTGGNDGRLDFTNNFMQRLGDVFDPDSGFPTAMSEPWLRSALFGDPVPKLLNQAVGQFMPSGAGGFNAGIGFEGSASVNPWDFVLMIEGALLFAAATARRLESVAPGVLAFPFAVYQTGAGYGTSTGADEQASRAEMWLPLWSRPTGVSELKALMSEGRARVGGKRNARSGADFARALASLGVDRGIDAFQRYGFLERFGRNYLATPLARVRVTRRPRVDLLLPIDRWLNRFLHAAKADETPSSVARTGRRVEAAIIKLASEGGTGEALNVLLALGEAEEAMARSLRWASGRSGVPPLPPLDPSWLEAVDDGTVELRLGAALASVNGRYGEGRGGRFLSMRTSLAPVRLFQKKDGRRTVQWIEDGSGDWVPPGPGIIDFLNRILRRRLLLARQLGHSSYPDRGWGLAGLDGITAFVEGRVDDRRLGRLLHALALLDWPELTTSHVLPMRSGERIRPSGAYALLKLCFLGHEVRGRNVALAPEIHALAASGDARALRMAAARLRGSGLPSAVDPVFVRGDRLRRTAAAILFPPSPADRNWMEAILRPELEG